MKRIIYITAWIVLGLLLSFLAHAGLEIGYINHALANNITVINQGSFGHGYCALPAWLQIGLLLAGVIGGYFIGTFFWRVIYIEKRVKYWRRK